MKYRNLKAEPENIPPPQLDASVAHLFHTDRMFRALDECGRRLGANIAKIFA